jgi:hypothetical protein
MIRFGSLIALTALAGLCAFAQPGPGRGPRPGPGGPGDFAFLRGEFGFAGKVVTGAPYSAQATTEFTQTLADGTHIQRSSTASVARDSQGRTRTEETMSAIGPLAASGGGSRTTVFIHDPVAGMSYVLDPKASTARQTRVFSRGPRFGNRRQGPRAENGAGPDSVRLGRHAQTAQTEDLGTQVIDGVTAQGKRVTRTIPVGQAGNDRAIQVVTETWYSPDLQVVVMSKTSDPRFGDNVYRLTNITRAEPDPALFSVPSGYTVQQGRPGRGPRPVQ